MVKTFYSEDGQKKEFNCVQFIDCGVQGNIYRLDDGRCLKCFNRRCSIDEKAFRIIAEMNLANFYKIYEILYKRKIIECKFASYVMEYYEKDLDFDILFMPIEYTLMNFYNIFDSVNKLSEKGIFVSDLHSKNVIINKEAITVIDVDMYTESKLFSKENLIRKNSLAVYSLFRRLYYNALCKYYYSSYISIFSSYTY